MTSAREAILAGIRQILVRDKTLTTAAAGQRQGRGPQPDWPEEDVERFVNKLKAVAASLDHATNESEVVSAIQTYLQQHDLPLKLVSAKSPILDKLAWPKGLIVEQRRAIGDDATVLTEAFAAVAETGSLVLLSSADSPTSLNFLPDNYLCLLRRDRIVRHIEDVWDRIRQEAGQLPRAVNFITGPSRTADVEQTIQLGAHGPRRLHVILYE